MTDKTDHAAWARLNTRVWELEAELAKERERGNRLNARNGRMETELSLKPESAAKTAMEVAYAEMEAERAYAKMEAERDALRETHPDYPGIWHCGECRRWQGDR